MNTYCRTPKKATRAYILLLALVVAAISLAIFVGISQWTYNSSGLNERHSTYNAALAAAEGATENCLAYMERDFYNQGFNPGSVGNYQARIPTNDWAANYQFSDTAGALNRTWVVSGPLSVTTNLDPRFAGLYGLSYSCQVRSQARPLNSPDAAAAAVEQDVQLVSIPLFQFAIFGSMDLEINPGPQMRVTGKVHSNGNLYTAPGTSLEYCDTVTTVGDIINSRELNDPQYGLAQVAPVFDGITNTHVPPLTMPIISNTVPAAVRSILQVPPFGESPLSAMGQARYYNQVDLIITTTSSGVTVRAGIWDGLATITPDLGALGGYSFVITTNSFWDAREQKWTVITDLDVGAMNRWLTNSGVALNNLVINSLGHPVSSVYVDDQRAVAGKLTAVRILNGLQLPLGGLTVATSLPVYILGNFNAPANQGTTNTSASLPASIAGDAITILSAGWSDANSTNSMTSRAPADTTINAALLAGIVPTGLDANGIKHYSGGIENFPRFLENWSGYTFTYNGSLVVMFPSQYATNYWVSPGSTVYNAPNRNWGFDANFKDYRRLPPATPQARQMLRGLWSIVAAN